MLKHITKAQIALNERLAAAQDDEGATMVEYGLIVAAIAVVVYVAAKALGDDVSALFDKVGGTVNP